MARSTSGLSRQLFTLVFKGSNPLCSTYKIALWCNGNTTGFGSVISGSNPLGATRWNWYMFHKRCDIQAVKEDRL